MHMYRDICALCDGDRFLCPSLHLAVSWTGKPSLARNEGVMNEDQRKMTLTNRRHSGEWWGSDKSLSVKVKGQRTWREVPHSLTWRHVTEGLLQETYGINTPGTCAGLCKSRSWTTATFQNLKDSTQEVPRTLYFICSNLGEGNASIRTEFRLKSNSIGLC